jgi:hypothetical protein
VNLLRGEIIAMSTAAAAEGGGAVARRIVRRATTAIIGTSGIVGTSLYLYSNTERGLGFKREINFWRAFVPVIFDYWWHASTSSPRVRIARSLGMDVGDISRVSTEGEGRIGGGGGVAADARDDEDDTARTSAGDGRDTSGSGILRELHERNAIRVYNSMLDLGGLYIKLGQVLSVTSLPVPEEYRALFRKLQSDVPNVSDFETVIRPTLLAEFEISNLDEVFATIDAIPCGAASIGQAHRAVLIGKGGGVAGGNVRGGGGGGTGEEVVVKVQYPNARWEVPADIECVGDLLKLCVFFGVVDGTSSKLSHDEFSRQFLMELDYATEFDNLKSVHASSLDPSAPYARRGVVIPRPIDDLCTDRVVTMTYLPGAKFETEARRQLASLGVDVGKRGMRDVVMMDADSDSRAPEDDECVGGGGEIKCRAIVRGGRGRRCILVVVACQEKRAGSRIAPRVGRCRPVDRAVREAHR